MLESQYQSSLTKACQRINESRDDVCVECVGYLLEELRDPKNVAAFKKDVESSNIFIGSLIFVQVRALPQIILQVWSETLVCLTVTVANILLDSLSYLLYMRMANYGY